MRGGKEMTTTVTMPIKEYERMKRDLERLEAESVYRYADRVYTDVRRNEYEITLDISSIFNMMGEKEGKPVTFKTI